MANASQRAADRVPLIVGVALLAIAALVFWDASNINDPSTYGMGPRTVPKLVAGFVAILGFAHLVSAFRSGFGIETDDIDPASIAWIVAGLIILIASIPLKLGFIPAMTALFACTARAFGRRAFAVDLGIGAITATIIYFIFTRLLTLGLPQGPIERLFG